MSKKEKARGVIRVGKFGFIKNPRRDDICRAYNDYVVDDKSTPSIWWYCPVLGGACKYVMDGKCTAAVCGRSGK